MSEVLKDRFITLCRKNGIQVTPDIYDYIFENETAQQFLSWYCDNFNSSNILNSQEVKLIKQVQCNILSEETNRIADQLKNLLSTCDSDLSIDNDPLEEYHCLFGNDELDSDDDDDDGDISYLKNIIKEAEEYNDSLVSANRTLQEEHEVLDQALEREDKMVQLAFQKMSEESVNIMKVSDKLDEAHRNLWENMKKVSDTVGYSRQPNSKPQMYYQLPLCEFVFNLEEYQYILKDLIIELTENAKEALVPYDRSEKWKLVSVDQNVMNIDQMENHIESILRINLDVVKKRYLECLRQYRPVMKHMDYILAAKALLKDIQDQKISYVSGEDLRKHLMKYEEKVKVLKNKLCSEYATLDEKAINIKVLEIQAEVGRHKRTILECWSNSCVQIVKYMNTLMLQSELLLRLERNESVSPRLMDFLEIARTYFVNNRNQFSERMELMKNIRTQHEDLSEQSEVCHPILEMCGRLLLPSEKWSNGISSELSHALVKAKDKLLDDVSQLEQYHLQSSGSWAMSLVEHCKSVLNTLKSKVFTGPVVQPEVLNYEVMLKLSEVADNMKELDYTYKKLKHDLKEKYVATMKSPSKRNEQLLWIRFLADERMHQKMNATTCDDTKSSADSEDVSKLSGGFDFLSMLNTTTTSFSSSIYSNK